MIASGRARWVAVFLFAGLASPVRGRADQVAGHGPDALLDTALYTSPNGDVFTQTKRIINGHETCLYERNGLVLTSDELHALELASPTPVLDLVSELHPTPAVGGVPTLSAVPWISATEPVPRGWYAGPIGWIDAAGDGELAVALRSGLLRGASAWLWAGAGIVRDSDPDAELAETHLKLGALLDALGVER